MARFSLREIGYLEQQMVGRLATASGKGIPHVAPVCYACSSEKIFIHTSRDSKKVRNIVENRRVAFVVDEYLSWEKNRGIIVQGYAEVLEGGEDFDVGRSLIYKKYPQWKQEFPIVEGEEILLAVIPEKILKWGLE